MAAASYILLAQRIISNTPFIDILTSHSNLNALVTIAITNIAKNHDLNIDTLLVLTKDLQDGKTIMISKESIIYRVHIQLSTPHPSLLSPTQITHAPEKLTFTAIDLAIFTGTIALEDIIALAKTCTHYRTYITLKPEVWICLLKHHFSITYNNILNDTYDNGPVSLYQTIYDRVLYDNVCGQNFKRQKLTASHQYPFHRR